MAIITIDNNSTTDIARQLLYRLDVDDLNGKIDPDNSKSALISNPLETASILRGMHAYFDTAEGGKDITSATESKVTAKTPFLSSATSDVMFNATFTGNNLKTGAHPIVTGLSGSYTATNYKDNNKVASNIEAESTGKTALKVTYDAAELNNNGTVSDIKWQSDTSSDSGYYYGDWSGKLVKYTGTYNSSMTGNITINLNENISGTINSYKDDASESGADGSSYKKSMNLMSSAGISINENQQFNGVVNSLSLSNSSSDSGYSGGISYKETMANSQVMGVLSQFIANQATTDDLAAALLINNDKITVKGQYTDINGYLGNDAITLGAGSDTVVFSTALSSANIDAITGFKKAGSDHLKLSSAIFSGYGGSDNLVIGTKAVDANDRIIYDNKTGKLYYDADGTGATAAIQFATLVGKPTLTASDIYTF